MSANRFPNEPSQLIMQQSVPVFNVSLQLSHKHSDCTVLQKRVRALLIAQAFWNALARVCRTAHLQCLHYCLWFLCLISYADYSAALSQGPLHTQQNKAVCFRQLGVNQVKRELVHLAEELKWNGGRKKVFILFVCKLLKLLGGAINCVQIVSGALVEMRRSLRRY